MSQTAKKYALAAAGGALLLAIFWPPSPPPAPVRSDATPSGIALNSSAGCSPSRTSIPAPLDRDDFERQMRGRHRTDVCSEFGAPSTTQRIGGRDYWYYSGITRDAMTGRVDSSVQVVFDDYGAVSSVNF